MIEPAALVWRDGQPYSAGYQDIYHSADGRDEVERVFLAPAGFQDLLARGRPLRVGELGFGTGLNFAVVARHCLRAGVRLHFVSFEAAPLRHEDLARICRDRQADEPVYTELLGRYPPLLGGWHHRRLHGGRTLLSIYFGAAGEGLADLRAQHHQPFDLWLLDGFAPDRNPDMWADDLLAAVGSTCLQDARVTTFTSAGRVRRGLAAAGFQMRRVDQRPHKWESLAGVFVGRGLAKRPAPERVTVVGAGIAGAAMARSLAEAGIAARVLERSPAPASGASSIPATVMHPRLHHDGSPGATLKATAYAHALAAVTLLADQPETGVRRTGALQIPSPNYPPERLAAVAERFAPCGIRVALLEGREAAELAGSTALRLGSPVLWFADACLVSTPELTRTLLAHPLIELCTGMSLAEWPEEPCVLACGMDARRLAGAEYLELGRVYGQLDLLRPHAGPLAALAVPIVGNGYVTPLPGSTAADPLIAAGATYEYAPWPAGQATERNLVHVARLAPQGATPTAAVRAERTVSSDRQPVIGPLFDMQGGETVGRLVSVGHGSMGTVSSHLAADLLTARLGGDFEPLAAEGRALVTPLRFRERQARRGYRFGAEP